MTILDKLQTIATSDDAPFHMPGHKRNTDLAPYLKTLSAHLDITEIDGADCLHHADGILKRAMDRASSLWNVPHSHLLVNGSTGGILSAIHATTKPGDHILMTRGCHKSVYHAVALCHLNPTYLTQPQSEAGYPYAVTVEQVAIQLEAHPETRLVVVTSPTYEGFLADIKSIASLCHSRDIPLLVDEAHGAHLGFTDYFKGSAVAAGADIVVQSLHKTLPSLTQTALLHCQGNLVDPQRVAQSLSIFETSSPSYLLMASMDGCLQLLEERGSTLFCAWQTNLEQFYQSTADLQHIKVISAPNQEKDPSKLLLSTAYTNLTGSQLMDELRQDYHIELEMAYGDYALAMTGMGDRPEHLQRLSHALHQMDDRLGEKESVTARYQLPPLPPIKLTAHQCHGQATKTVAVTESVGAICGSYLWVYPPGIPILVPGEEITPAVLKLLQRLTDSGGSVQDSGNLWPKEIAIIP